jgi:hypothetical protein
MKRWGTGALRHSITPTLHCSIAPRPHLQTARVGDIARPNDPFDQYPPRILPLCRCPHDPRDPDATSQKRGPGRSVWRRGNGKHFRGANDQCADENHRLARGYLLSPHLHPLDSLRAKGQYQKRTWQRAEERSSPRTAGFTDSHSKSCHHGRRFTHPGSISTGDRVARNGHQSDSDEFGDAGRLGQSQCRAICYPSTKAPSLGFQEPARASFRRNPLRVPLPVSDRLCRSRPG